MSSTGGFSDAEPLSAGHVLAGFDCGEPALNTWLAKHAWQSHAGASSRTRVVCREGRVVGFYSLAAGSVSPAEAPARIIKGLPNQRVPVAVLTRLAVDVSVQGSGLGSALLKDALVRIAEVADTVAVRALLVNAKNDSVKAWYQRRVPFLSSPVDELQLFLLLKELRAAVGGGR